MTVDPPNAAIVFEAVVDNGVTTELWVRWDSVSTSDSGDYTVTVRGSVTTANQPWT
jgi:hypothetical protein